MTGPLLVVMKIELRPAIEPASGHAPGLGLPALSTNRHEGGSAG
ncbi:MAG: hypothetical protein U0838_06960 [Chloroflexota bacterium]